MKTILSLLVVFSTAFSGVTKAAVTAHTLLNDVVYFADSDADRPFILRYDVANEEQLSSLSLDTPPTAISSDSSGVYVAQGNTLSRLVFSGNVATRTVLHNFPADVLQIVPAGDFLLVVSGSPKQTVYVLKQDGGDIEGETEFAEDDYGLIEGIHHDNDNDHIIIKFSAAINDSVFIVASYNDSTGVITELDKFPDGNITTFTTPNFFGDFGLIVGSLGEVAEFGATGVELRSPDINKDNPITLEHGNDEFYSAGTVTAVFEDADNIILATAIDNACHSFNGGTRFRVIDNVPLGLTEGIVFDSANVVHTIVAFGGSDFLLFSGAAEALVVEKRTELTAPTLYGSTVLDPLAVNFTPVQKLSAVGKDGDVLHMHVDATCDHQLVSWQLSTQSYLPTVVNLQINTPIDTSYSVNENQFWVLNNRTKDFYLRMVDFEDDDPVSVGITGFSGIVGQASQVVATDSYAVLRYQIEAVEYVAVISLDTKLAISNDVTLDKSWDVAAWDAANGRIYYLSDGKLFSRELVGAILDDAFQSPDYGITQPASTSSEIVVSADGDFLIVGGGRYDTASLNWLDSIGNDEDNEVADVAAWSSASTVYAFNSGGNSALEEWSLSLGGDDHFELLTETSLSADSSNNNTLLFPMMQGGLLVPLTVTVNSASTLTYKTQGDNAISVSLGGGGSAGSGSDVESGTGTDSGSDTTSGTDSSQPAEPLGGTGGGSIDYVYILLLTLGFAVRLRKLS